MYSHLNIALILQTRREKNKENNSSHHIVHENSEVDKFLLGKKERMGHHAVDFKIKKRLKTCISKTIKICKFKMVQKHQLKNKNTRKPLHVPVGNFKIVLTES